ncbi:MAG: hypothetical protein ABGY96_13490 [bacterium]|nr:hypothetical protein [Gammaproteobacteria bacterium]HIL97368.1 hypothetical protein [Pseudomonadales bacterium]
MKKISKAQVQEYVAKNKLLMGNLQKPMLMLTPDNEMIKSFFRKERLSTSTFFPKAVRFAENAKQLKKIGVLAPLPKEVMYCSEMAMHMVIYNRLPGTDLRVLNEGGDDTGIRGLPRYLAELHTRGVMFRGIHLGNVLYLGKEVHQSYALVDISGMSIKKRQLRLWERMRNLINLLGVDDDKDIFDELGVNWFLSRYCRAAVLDSGQINYLQKRLTRKLKRKIEIDQGYPRAMKG